MIAKGNGRLRAVKYINHLIVIARMVGKPLGQLGRPEVEKLVSKINTSDYKDNTKRDYKIILKRYFQWIRQYDEDERQYPDEVRWIKTTQKKGRLLPEALLSVEDARARSPEKGKKERYICETIEHYLPLAAKHSSYFYDMIIDELNKVTKQDK